MFVKLERLKSGHLKRTWTKTIIDSTPRRRSRRAAHDEVGRQPHHRPSRLRFVDEAKKPFGGEQPQVLGGLRDHAEGG